MRSIEVECKCGRNNELDASSFGVKPVEFDAMTVAENLGRFRCKICRNQPNFIFNEGNLLFDLTNITNCAACELPIPIARLNAVPGTAICTICAREGESDHRSPPPYPQPPTEAKTCPRCNSATQMRQNSKDKSWFVGCSTYPKCRYTKNL